MTITLTKGQRISFDKVAPGLSEVFVGLGWDLKATDTGHDFDLDSSIFLLNANGKLISDAHLIFYNNQTSPDPDKSVQHLGDNLTGAGEGDDEVMKINLKKVPSDIQTILIAVTIHEAETRRQNFGQVQNAFVRVVNSQTNEEVVRYDLVEDYSTETCMIMAELYFKEDQWRINAVGSGYQGGLEALLGRYK
ncbi:TerD family protein [Scytonema hofmannii FACHB-248]|uniref:TerD family protein n=1 Tax=Scytonema hofmannii FACHB-248 TaxID=1842502 RepID=A0ABR8GVC6_9CYAN|nr:MULTISPECIES: TerD family protein [Nostocales]MBD2607075.1 TerD family protein [Scytonema hofmannii FACHB-248]